MDMRVCEYLLNFVDEVGSHFFLSHEIVGFDDDSMMCGINGVDGVCGGTNGTTTRTTITSVLFQPINP